MDQTAPIAGCSPAKASSTRPTHRKIVRALGRIEREWAAGAFTLDPTLEDVHMNIERAVAQLEGESAAGVMHTARSRNDQSATDVRLWLRDRLLERLAGLGGLIDALARLAARHAKTIAPGWTHGQPAMPTHAGPLGRLPRLGPGPRRQGASSPSGRSSTSAHWARPPPSAPRGPSTAN